MIAGASHVLDAAALLELSQLAVRGGNSRDHALRTGATYEQSALHMVVLQGGSVVTADPETQVGIDVVGAGEGFYAARPLLVRALSPVAFVRIALSALPLANARELARVCAVLLGAAARADRLTQIRALSPVDERVLTALRELVDSSGRCLPLRQRDLGNLIGMRNETVCRSLRRLEVQGLVTWERSGATVRAKET